MAEEKSYYVVDPGGRYRCLKCGVPLVKGDAVFGYLDNAFPVELPVCPKCGFVFVPEGLARGKVLSVEKVLEDKRRRGTPAVRPRRCGLWKWRALHRPAA